MKKLLLILLTCTDIAGAFAAGDPGTTVSAGEPSYTANRISSIDASDSVLIDLDNFIKAGNDIAVPVFILTDDTIYSLDFSFKYNHDNLTYDTMVNQTAYIQPLAYYNPVDSTVRLTSYSSSIPYATGTTLLYVHFNLLAWQLTNLDLFSLNAYLNGDPCTFSLIGGIPSGIGENEKAGFRVYPNPVLDGMLQVEVPVAVTATLLDMTGRACARYEVPAGKRFDIATAAFPVGTYLLRFQNDESTVTRKVVIY